MPKTFIRTRLTWLAYFMLALFSFFLNILGPITPFLKDEFHLTYTVSSLHFSAFAAGILLMGLVGHVIIQRTGRVIALGLGGAGLSLGAVLLTAGRTPVITIGAAFLMGFISTLILAVVPAALSDEHGEHRAVAISEANVLSSFFGAGAAVLVGWMARTALGWRAVLVVMAIAPILIWMTMGRDKVSDRRSGKTCTGAVLPAAGQAEKPRLGAVYWFYWAALVLAVSVEFCMISWSADYLGTELGMQKADAAQAVSIFLAAMIVGRWACSRLVLRFQASAVVFGSIALALAGFIAYWTAASPLVGLIGLFVTGLGTAGLYPMILSMAIASAGPSSVQGGARASLASGTAILALPLTLGRLADQVGIRSAYGVVAVLLVSAFLLVLATGWIFKEPQASRYSEPV